LQRCQLTGHPSAAAVLQVLTALPLLLQHCQDSKEQFLLLRTLLKVSKSFRRSAQCSGVRCSIDLRVWDGRRAASFAAWLSQHAGLVGKMSATCDHWRLEGAFEMLFVQAVRSYRSQPAQATDSSSSCVLSTATLGLSSLRLGAMEFSSILQAIQPADNLTSLCLTGKQQHFTGSTLAGLSTLRNLRQLELTDNDEYNCGECHLPMELYSAVAKMSYLTSLTVKWAQVSEGVLQQLPPSLQVLTLHGKPEQESPASLPDKLSLQHLQDLQQLTWGWPERDAGAVRLALPPRVTSVMLEGKVHAELPRGVLHVSIPDQERCMPVVQQLPALRGLKHLVLGSEHRYHNENKMQVPQAQQVASVLGSMQQLTFLHLDCKEWRRAWRTEVQLGTTLQHLQGLKHLHVKYAELTEADALRLTCLTNLTHLGLPCADVNNISDDELHHRFLYRKDGALAVRVIAGLAGKLTGLVALDVSGCGLKRPGDSTGYGYDTSDDGDDSPDDAGDSSDDWHSPVRSRRIPLRDKDVNLLSVFCKLKKLRQLKLHDNENLAMTKKDVFRLTVLSELTELSLPGGRGSCSLSYADQQSFCAAIPHLVASRINYH
jgi:hypothetical protein